MAGPITTLQDLLYTRQEVRFLRGEGCETCLEIHPAGGGVFSLSLKDGLAMDKVLMAEPARGTEVRRGAFSLVMETESPEEYQVTHNFRWIRGMESYVVRMSKEGELQRESDIPEAEVPTVSLDF
jgi:hypothetical protein